MHKTEFRNVKFLKVTNNSTTPSCATVKTTKHFKTNGKLCHTKRDSSQQFILTSHGASDISDQHNRLLIHSTVNQ